MSSTDNKNTKIKHCASIAKVCLIITLLFSHKVSMAQAISDITDLILITGQSNVTGSQTEYNASADGTNIRLFAFTSNNDWEIADLHQAWDVDGWHPGNGSITDTSRSPYNSFAFHFGKTIVNNDPSRVVGIIVASAPGQGIRHWDNGSAFSQTIESKVLAALNAQGIKAQLDGILWHQGETDWQYNGTSDPDASAAEKSYPTYYPEKLDSLIQRFRNTSWFGENKPFICGETKQALVNGRLMELNTNSDPWTGCVQGSDLTTREMDLTATPPKLGTHFDAAGLRTLGQRYAIKYLSMTSDNTAPSATILTPSGAGISLGNAPTLTGTVTDNTGGSGVDRLSVVLYSHTTNSFVDLNGSPGNWKQFHASIPAGNPQSANWSLPSNLSAGSYTMYVYPYDAAGNFSPDNRISRYFTVTSADSIAPTAAFLVPATPGASLQLSPTLSGTASDNPGGSGIERVALVIWSQTTRSFVALDGTSVPWTQFAASIPTTNPTLANWSLPTSLPQGSYIAHVYPSDRAGNYNIANRISRSFIVTAGDNTAPTATIATPATSSTVPLSPTLAGTATDNAGGSGIKRVSAVIWSHTIRSFVDLNGAPAAWTQFQATIPSDNPLTVNWQLSTTLPAGRYTAYIYPYDAEGNYDISGRAFSTFFVE